MAALQEHAALHVECQASMFTHLYNTAACMSPDQAKFYLETGCTYLRMSTTNGSKRRRDQVCTGKSLDLVIFDLMTFEACGQNALDQAHLI